ncbi:hypothetical protein DCAR_0206209 [Daucus carota subsp. sativus]|uniref:PB1-like domain-containing protein n=1 Tax=Daucus carota subsp. sativus TaxID=79200 RepID=A0AAF0WBR3_DAUCS|nr:PREDICTED: uncharacterized protein LOC108208036 [Daucus carota subsp. sativus]WOG86990.1 hypothetical protein DCAR_0206209 [Daucus carota subsp. sativus]
MESLISIYVHHHGELSHVPKVEYKGGKVDFILGFDTDVFSFRDLDDFAEKYGYSPTDLVYFQTSGMSIEGGVKLLYDDNTVREMVDIHKPLGRIDLYVDHYEFDEVIDVAHESILKGSENVELGGNEENEGEGLKGCGGRKIGKVATGSNLLKSKLLDLSCRGLVTEEKCIAVCANHQIIERLIVQQRVNYKTMIKALRLNHLATRRQQQELRMRYEW